MELRIETTDLTFLKDLKNANIPDIQIFEPMAKAANSLEAFKIVVTTITVSFITSVAANIFTNWLQNRNIEKGTRITSINNTKIINEITVKELLVIIEKQDVKIVIENKENKHNNKQK